MLNNCVGICRHSPVFDEPYLILQLVSSKHFNSLSSIYQYNIAVWIISTSSVIVKQLISQKCKIDTTLPHPRQLARSQSIIWSPYHTSPIFHRNWHLLLHGTNFDCLTEPKKQIWLKLASKYNKSQTWNWFHVVYQRHRFCLTLKMLINVFHGVCKEKKI